ncbi:hypothetical protein EPUS_04853 [Endocarpon pusillum Z07020]|uniref:Transcription factor domain-containing protein n=1 Tax=Endocarpon pusillum (strain Z07020 / HMAS-L-300199) TaxID=1263415 RepID=U1GSU3_ENDPU|nr:uncharacterized protein EPUS_04853 [Endocarpon pusillum Z07020]ERF75071.1 hypothetical protein EPUS_04853 [Endocarpon pusillum Z07020]
MSLSPHERGYPHDQGPGAGRAGQEKVFASVYSFPQCTRLGHTCDYSPRLSFRDDTPRVVERMQDVSTLGSSVWDPTSPTATEAPSSVSGPDDLPAFATLRTDEEREKKAECTSPGTYNVIVNPESFQHLPEYGDDAEVKILRLSPLRRGSLAASMASSQGREPGVDNSHQVDGVYQDSEDPNVVILPRFEDATRRATLQWKDFHSPTPPRLTTHSSGASIPILDSLADTEPTQSLMQRAAEGGQDAHLLQHFRNHIWQQLAQVEHESMAQASIRGSGIEVLEHAARLFPPLFHAMMAVAALGLAHQEGSERLDALQHYQKALPALQSNLRSADDLSSDGAFLTHFLLLVYEIAAAEIGGSNLWSSHLAQLLRISLLRREVFGGEQFPFITWWICNIDLYALFSGAGTGEFVGTMLKNDMMPPPSFHLYPLSPDGSSIIYAGETESLPTILQLNYEVTVLAVRLGLLAQELRRDATALAFDSQEMGSHHRHVSTKLRQQRVYELQEALRQLWLSPSTLMLGQQPEMLPPRSRQSFEHASALYRACLIYSHTSMWPSQRLDSGPECDHEIAESVSEILRIGNRVVSSEQYHRRFIIFPLFMAGFASIDGNEKMLALELISSMEKRSIGSNTTATRHALQIVYEQQTQRFMLTGQSSDVNWSDIMLEQGLQVVNFGL